jgi:hypothetical protein
VSKRRDLWHTIAVRNGIGPGSDEEKAFVRRVFSIEPGTFDANLSRGFARRHLPAIRDVCKAHKLPFDPADWCPPRPGAGESREPIGWAGRPIATADDFYERLCSLYDSATTYRVLRVGGTFSRNRTTFRFENNLAIQPTGASPRIEYLRRFWTGVRDGSLSGTSVHVVRTVDRLVELWACVEMLQDPRHGKDLHHANLVYMAPIPPSDAGPEIPTVGMRVIDHDKTLLSLPAPLHGESRYSSWIESDRLAGFAWDYITRVRDISSALSTETRVGLKEIMRRAFGRLDASKPGNYGILDHFSKVEEIKDRMLKWADTDTPPLWLPVIG